MRFVKYLLPFLATSLCFAQADRLAGPIHPGQMVALTGQIHHKALPQYDQGRVSPSLPMNQVTLLTLPSASQQAALELLLAQQQDKKSPNYHKWLTPEQWADRFGLSQNDVNSISTWLKSQGLTVVSVARGRNWIVFGGTASQIENAFRTEFHNYNVKGEKHFANATAPSIPAALSGIVTGFRGFDDFKPKPAYVRKAAIHGQKARPDYYDGTFVNPDFLAPGDIATIYDINALYNAGYDGSNQSMVIVGQTDVYLADLNAFRTGFGLTAISGCSTDSTGVITDTSCNTSNFEYVLDGADPGVATVEEGDLTEADLDLEWSAATARGAKIIFVNSTDVYTSYYYAIDNDLAPVMSMSYGGCEFGDNLLSSDETELKKANAEGITFFNSSGDSGVAICDGSTNSSSNLAELGISVSYPASSPEVTAVGGTAIDYLTGFSSQYWSTSIGAFGGTAQNPPLPEIAWNDDAELVEDGQFTSAETVQEQYAIVSSGGGVSNCSVQTSDFSSCVSGFPQPSWQTVSIPSQASGRFVPDVSLLASPNFPSYIYCTPVEELAQANASPYNTETTSSCGAGTAADITASVNGIYDSTTGKFTVGPSLVGGTSASSPIFAGIATILNQYLGSNGLGNINPTLYTLAQNTSNGAFHQVTSGNNMVYCEGGEPTYQPVALRCPGAIGSTNVFGYDASNADTTSGYNLVTGLGSVDANALAVAWAASRAGSSITINSSASAVEQGASVTFTATVTPTAGVGAVKFTTVNNGSTVVLGTATLNVPYPSTTTGTATFTTTALPGGNNTITATYQGDSSLNSSTSASTQVTVTVPFTMAANPSTIGNLSAGQTAVVTLTLTPASGFTGSVNFTNSTPSSPGSCTAGLPAGELCSFSSGSVAMNGTSPSTVTMTITTSANMILGSQSITVSGTSGTAVETAVVTLTVTGTNQGFSLQTNASTFSAAQGATAAVNVSVIGTGSPLSFVTNGQTALPLTYTCVGTPSLATAEISCLINGSNQPTSNATVTVSLVTTPQTSQLTPPLGRGRSVFYALLLPGLFGIVFLGGSRSRATRLLSLIVVLGCSTLWLGACGGGGGGGGGLKNPGTPAGSYAVTISATTGGGANALTNSAAVTLNVTAQ